MYFLLANTIDTNVFKLIVTKITKAFKNTKKFSTLLKQKKNLFFFAKQCFKFQINNVKQLKFKQCYKNFKKETYFSRKILKLR